MSSFIDSGVGFVLYICFVLALVLNSEKDLGVVWCSYNEQKNHLRVHRRLLTNRLHGKAAELCLANSRNNRVKSTKYIEYINSIHGTLYSFLHVVLVKFYCDVITRSHLQFINTTFFSKLHAFLAEQRRRRKASDG